MTKSIKFAALVVSVSVGLFAVWFFRSEVRNKPNASGKEIYKAVSNLNKTNLQKRGVGVGIEKARDFIRGLKSGQFDNVSEIEITSYPGKDEIDVFVTVRAFQSSSRASGKEWHNHFTVDAAGDSFQKMNWDMWDSSKQLIASFSKQGSFDLDEILLALAAFDVESSDNAKIFSEKTYSSNLRFFVKDEKLQITDAVVYQGSANKSKEKIFNLSLNGIN